MTQRIDYGRANVCEDRVVHCEQESHGDQRDYKTCPWEPSNLPLSWISIVLMDFSSIPVHVVLFAAQC